MINVCYSFPLASVVEDFFLIQIAGHSINCILSNENTNEFIIIFQKSSLIEIKLKSDYNW